MVNFYIKKNSNNLKLNLLKEKVLLFFILKIMLTKVKKYFILLTYR